VFEPFSESSDYFRSDKQVLINLRVRDMDALVTQLGDAGIELANDLVEEGVGRFVRIHDPEGNPIELWEPPAA
jgi:predicted enzyme related to lactoylglutathione lyase